MINHIPDERWVNLFYQKPRPKGFEPQTYWLEILWSGGNCFVHKHGKGSFEPQQRVASNSPISNKSLTTQHALLTDELSDEPLKTCTFQKKTFSLAL